MTTSRVAARDGRPPRAYLAGGVASAVAGLRLGSVAALLPAFALAAVAARAR